MFTDAEPEVAGQREVLLFQFVFLHLEASLEDLLGLGSSDCDVDCDLLVSSDAEGADGVSCFACAESF